MNKTITTLLCCLLAGWGFAQQSVTSLTLINSDTDLPMVGYETLTEGMTLDLATLPSVNMNVRANTSPTTVGSVRFTLDAATNYRTESTAPYAMAGDTSGDYWNWTPLVGSHTVTATPYTDAGAGGTGGTPLTIHFTVTNSASSGGGGDPVVLGSFDKAKDIFLPQFDSNHDPDDIHSIAALGCMLVHDDYQGINYFAVHGAYGEQNIGNFIESPQLFHLVFGAENEKWVNASPQNPSWNGAVAKIAAKVKPVLLAGGKAWVAEAGQSDITADWVRALIADGIPAASIKTNVVVVQHSNWNEDMTTDADLAYVKSMCAYQTINDGNGTSTARDPSAPATPAYRSTSTAFQPAALTSQNKKAKAYWQEAEWVINDEGYFPDHSSISTGGVDFSDVVESHWIFGAPTDCDTTQKFWDKFVTNLPVPNNEPDFPTGRDYGDGGTVTPTSGTWIEKDGILAIEMEHGELHEDWTVQPSTYLVDPTMAGSMGDGWIEWAGAQIFNTTIADSQANGVSVYRFQINKAGDYTFRWRSKQYNAGQAGDQGNDTYVKFETGTPLAMTANNGSTQTMTKYTKVWVQSKLAWSWGTNFEPAHGVFVVNPKVHYEPGLHEIRIAGRSKGHTIDRFVLYHSTANGSTAQTSPESERVTAALYVYQATNDFPVINSGAVPYYKDNGNNALAINAANESYRDQWARAELIFDGSAGAYDVTLTALKELDGECSYRLLINGSLIGEVKNATTTVDYQEQDHVFAGVNIPAGATIAVESITHSNGKVQETGQPAGVWAWARGRWRSLSLASNGTGTGISVNAGEDQMLLLPTAGTQLIGTASDDGAISSVEWTQVSGPTDAVLTGSGQTNVAVSGLTGGTYVFQLTATDNEANTASDEVEVTVTGQLAVYSDDFSSAAYASSLNGVNWNPKWKSATDQQNLHTGNGSVAVLDTTVAAESFHTPCKHGFSLSAEGQYAVMGSDFRYNHMAVSGVTVGLSKAVSGLLLSGADNWWTGPNKFFSIANYGIGIGPVDASLDDVIEHTTLGVDRSVGGFSDWFRIEWTIERGAANYMGKAKILDDGGAVLYTGPQVDLGFPNGSTVFGGYSTGGDGGNGTTTNVASYSHISEVNMDNFEIKVFAPNYAPYFKADPIVGNSAEKDIPYTGNLLNDTLDPNGDELTFFKDSGPAWLTVSSAGVLSGTPADSDVGMNYFSVRVVDPDGLSDTADLNIDVADGPPPLALTSLWAEDFEGAALDAASGNNQTLAGTVIQTANTLSSKVVAAPAAFSSASDHVILLSSSSNQFSAIRPAVNPIDLSAYNIRSGDKFVLSFDIYIPTELTNAVGSVNFRWKDGSNAVNGSTDTTYETLAAGQHHIEYMGTFPVNTGGGDFIPTSVRPFIWFDQDGAVISDHVYFDNLDFKIGSAPAIVMPAYIKWADEVGLAGGQVNPTLDIDGDGLTNMEEFLSGFSPVNEASVFNVDAVQTADESGEKIIVQWETQPGRTYSVMQADSLTDDSFDVLAEGLAYPQSSHTVDVAQANGFLRVDVRLQ
ncbi:hypothetical protein SCARR_04546 [Pontiella sulfatireligans]|uniref:Dystroglycan-type cadherin-like domain-containing protein n=2 Tax=Pontiella sulfatireligans TaxID=2750658 RepID=A0A6C2UR87_9BACT|nr:hypothetical protein SCARR_04546 [Pontiella sulfatireligans]